MFPKNRPKIGLLMVFSPGSNNFQSYIGLSNFLLWDEIRVCLRLRVHLNRDNHQICFTFIFIQFQTRATFNRGHRDIAKFAVYREISRNLLFTAKYLEICCLPRNIAKFAVNREKFASLRQTANLSYFLMNLE